MPGRISLVDRQWRIQVHGHVGDVTLAAGTAALGDQVRERWQHFTAGELVDQSALAALGLARNRSRAVMSRSFSVLSCPRFIPGKASSPSARSNSVTDLGHSRGPPTHVASPGRDRWRPSAAFVQAAR